MAAQKSTQPDPWTETVRRHIPSIMSVVIGALATSLATWLFIDVQNTLRSFEHRLTILETRAENSTKLTLLGKFWWGISRGYAFYEGKVRLGLEIDVLSEQFRWKCASPSVVLQGTDTVDLAAVIRGYSNDQQLKDALGIIAIGTASAEGLKRGQEDLARSRVETLVNLLQDNISKPKMQIYGYWLGQYVAGDHDAPCTDTTANQRRVVLLKIVEMQKNLSMKEKEQSITAVLMQKATIKGILFPIDVRNYSRFQRRQDLLIWGRNLRERSTQG